MTQLVFAAPNSQADATFEGWSWEERPLHMLASFAYPDVMARVQRLPCGSRMLDSGAFTAYHRKQHIDIDALIAEAKTGKWDEVVALDVIGDPDASVRNADYMREQGVEAMPVFHIGDPWEHLAHYTANWRTVGLSCRFGESVKESLRFYRSCFAKGWPCRFHSFGWIQRDALIRFPFWSADAATWIVASASYRNVMIEGKGKTKQVHLPVEGDVVPHIVRTHLEAGWKLQQEMTSRWRRVLAEVA